LDEKDEDHKLKSGVYLGTKLFAMGINQPSLSNKPSSDIATEKKSTHLYMSLLFKFDGYPKISFKSFSHSFR